MIFYRICVMRNLAIIGLILIRFYLVVSIYFVIVLAHSGMYLFRVGMWFYIPSLVFVVILPVVVSIKLIRASSTASYTLRDTALAAVRAVISRNMNTLYRQHQAEGVSPPHSDHKLRESLPRELHISYFSSFREYVVFSKRNQFIYRLLIHISIPFLFLIFLIEIVLVMSMFTMIVSQMPSSLGILVVVFVVFISRVSIPYYVWFFYRMKNLNLVFTYDQSSLLDTVRRLHPSSTTSADEVATLYVQKQAGTLTSVEYDQQAKVIPGLDS